MNLILARYVMRSALLAMLGAVVGLWVLQMLFAYLSELENLNDHYSFVDALWFVVYKSPYFLIQFMPTGVLLGGVVGLGLLASSSELVVMRAAGLSKYKIIGWAMIPALLFVLVSLSVNQFVLPITNQKAEEISTPSQNKKLFSVQGYWSVSQGDNGQEIVYIDYADSKGDLGETKKFFLNTDSNLTQVVRANSGKYQQSQSDKYLWQLNDVYELEINSDGVMRQFSRANQLTLPIAPNDVHLLIKDAEDLSLTDLYAYRQLMNHQHKHSLRHELAFWQKLFSPLSVLSLVLLASSFVFGSLRSQSLGVRIVMALLTGLLFSYLTDLVGFISLVTGISPFIMAILPIIISALAGVYLLEKRQ